MSGGVGDLTGRSVSELLEIFASLGRDMRAHQHGGYINRLYRTRERVVKAIKGRSDGTVRALLPLLSHEDPHLRLDAAYVCNEIEPGTSLRILRELALRDDKIGREAQSSIKSSESLAEMGFVAERKPSPPASASQYSFLCDHGVSPGMSHAELESLLFESFPREIARALMALARPAIRVWPRPIASASDMGSRLGGLPVVAKNWQWPTTSVWIKGSGLEFLQKGPEGMGPRPQEPDWFLAQINCADLKGFAAASVLPATGILSFFADSDIVTGCSAPWEYGGLYYFSGNDLYGAAEPIEDFETLPVCGLAFAEMMDLPDPRSVAIGALELGKPLHDLYRDIRKRVNTHAIRRDRLWQTDHSKMLGWPDLVQRDLESCSEEAIGDERLLFQIGNYDNGIASWGWGPGGLVYFVMSAAALAQCRVQEARYEMQCT